MSLHIEIKGHGHPLVLIHGWGMHGGVWQPLLKKLSQHYQLHIVDLPGMGHSRPLEPAHLHAVAETLAAQLPPNVDVCGWSMGGLVAMRLALTHPEVVRRMVLIGSSPRFVNAASQDEQWEYGIAADVFHQFASQVNTDYHATLIKFLTLQCMGSSDARATVKQLRATFAERPVPTAGSLQKALQILLENDLRQEILHLHKPVLLIHGDRDTLAPLQAAHWLSQHLPFGRLRVIAGAGHAPFLSHPDQFVHAIDEFLEPGKSAHPLERQP
jgi:pimeloyl-[acyl-carrier protein] methyl ester esterase